MSQNSRLTVNLSLWDPVFQLCLPFYNTSSPVCFGCNWPVQISWDGLSFACLNPITSASSIMSVCGLQSIKYRDHSAARNNHLNKDVFAEHVSLIDRVLLVSLKNTFVFLQDT